MKEKFKYVVISVVLLIPFIYSFFYLKAYWNPYGEGNIDNIPVAIVNSDRGDKGQKLIKSIKNSKKLKLKEVSKEDAEDGLSDGKYYAMITIPETFSKDMESASEVNKHHATITYSPNQKANFLASQIINSVVNAVEKSLDNEVNSAIVDKLSNNIEEVPSKLETISNGFSTLKDGTSKLNNGSITLREGTNTLNDNYNKFNSGIFELNSGTLKLKEGSNKLSSGLNTAKDGSLQIKGAVDSKITELQNDTSKAISDEELYYIGQSAKQSIGLKEQYIKQAALEELYNNEVYNQIVNGMNQIEANYINNGITSIEACGVIGDETQVAQCQTYLTKYEVLKEEKTLMETVTQNAAYTAVYNASELIADETAAQVADTAKQKATQTSITSLSELSSSLGQLNNGLNDLYNGSLELSSGLNSLSNGTNTLYNSSNRLQSGITTLNNGAQTLSNGMNTLDSSVLTAKKELDSNIDTTKTSIKKVENLSEYSKSPVKINTKEVNKVSSYGLSFSPLFISIGLWIGCLMMFMVFYYDKEERFGVLGMNSNNKVKQILSYHGLITISSVVLGILLHILLNLELTNPLLYYISLILIGNTFMGIIELLIICFNDIGKFIALILLVLQLAAAGGTFPIETVTKGFRWLNNFLPMTYTINLLKESLMTIQDNLLTKNILIIILLGVLFFIINFIIARKKEQNEK